MRKPNKKATAIIAASIIVAGSGGAAFAYWTATGSGTGTASTGAGTQAVTANQTSVITDLRPGADAQDIFGTFENPNDEPVYVTSVTVSISSVVKADGAPDGTCSAADYALVDAVMPVNAEINDNDAWDGATIAFNNTGVNQDACKGATVNLAYAVV